MKVALYYPWVYLMSGSERLILEVTGRSRHDWTVLTNHYDREATFPALAERHVIELSKIPVRRSMAKVASGAARVLTQKLPLEGQDALVVLCEGVGDFTVFRAGPLPKVCLCLTPLRPAFDPLYRERAMAERNVVARWILRAGLAAFRVADRAAWRNYARVLCVSDHIRDRVVQNGLADADKVEVAHVGVSLDGDGFEPAYEPFFLVAGRIMWTKNIEVDIDAFRRFRSASPAHAHYRLVIAGMVDRKSEAYLAHLRERAQGDPSIEFRVAPPDAELRELYRTCYAVLFASFNEDWGIVPIEAMSFAKPLIATNRGGPSESIQHGIQGYTEPPTAEHFARRMAELVADPALARRMGAAGRQRARQFSWAQYVSRLDDVLDMVAASDGARDAVAGSAGRATSVGETS